MLNDKQKIIAVDVDGTVVDSGSHFSLWMTRQSWFRDKFADPSEALDYAWTKYTPWEGIDLSPEHVQLAKDWWKRENLYDVMSPIHGVVESLEELHELGHKIIFASHCEGHHGKSKVNFLKKYFPFMSGFLATRQKQFVRCDVLVDDRAYNLNNLPKEVLPVYQISRYEDKDINTINNIPKILTFNKIKEII